MDRYLLESKTVYLEKNQTKTSSIFTLFASKMDKLIDFRPIISQVPGWHDKFFQIYSPQQDHYIPLQTICDHRFLIPKQYVQLNIIMMKYLDQPLKQESDHSEESNKKQRSKERTIKQVIDLVRRWRQLHNQSSETKRLNLQESAKIVGISKKSLDDYFFQLRMGEKYNFDFTAHMECKIGVLRSFVKNKEIQLKGNNKQKITKHNKKLRIIQQFEQKLTLDDKRQIRREACPAELREQEEEKHECHQEQKKKVQCGFHCAFHFNKLMDSQQLFWGSPFSPIQEKEFNDCENNFFKDFQNLIEQPNDPFIPYTGFKKCKSIFGDDQNLSAQIDF